MQVCRGGLTAPVVWAMQAFEVALNTPLWLVERVNRDGLKVDANERQR